MTSQEVASKHLTAPLREMVEEINICLPINEQYSFQALHLWLKGTRRPRYLTMLYLYDHASGWVKEFAADMLAALKENRNGTAR